MRIFITEEQSRALTNSLRNEDFSKITYMLDNKEDVTFDSINFAKKLFKITYKNTVDSFSDDITSIDKTKVLNKFSRLLSICKKKEAKLRSQLEKLCADVLLQLFDVPTDEVYFSCELVDEIDQMHQFHIKPDTNEEFQYDSMYSIHKEDNEVRKRKILNILINGCSSYLFAKAQTLYLSRLFELDEELPHLYNKLIKLNDYLVLTNNIEITDKNHYQGAYVNVRLGSDEKKSQVEVKAMLFPMLLLESIRGFAELFISNGLPDDISEAERVVNKSDILIEEPWNKRFGEGLWSILIKNKEINTKVIPDFLGNLSQMETNDFLGLISELENNTKNGDNMVTKILDDAVYSTEYSSFENDMTNKISDKSIVEDSYFTVDELSNY